MKTRDAIIIVLASLVTLLACADARSAPKNIIFFIGDGMGPEQVKAAAIYAYGAPGTLSFESFPYQGKLTTYSANSSITDSAAAATALATGIKVNNGVISMAYPGDGSELETLLEYSKSLGKSTGLVMTTYVEHATPAGFGAHEPSRDNYTQIATDYLTQTQPNILFGGCSYTSAADSYGYVEVFDRAGMLALDTDTIDKVSGQFGSGMMPYEYDGLGSLPHLSEMTATALDILDKDPDGFFLMIEGGLIDKACESNSLIRSIYETIELANAVQVAINWAAGRSDTLILVAADHETGGLTVTANNGAGVLPSVTWAGTGHTAADVPVYAWGVNAELISGIMNNTDMLAVAVSDEPIELVSPAYDAANVSTSPSLEVTVHDPDGTGDPLDVTFFGREKPSFTVVVLPDSQKYLLNGAYPEIFTSQTQWIVDNVVSENIVFMTHEGDIVDTWNSTTEWGYANESISLLDGVVPYGLAVGNHDKYENPADPMYDTVSTYFNQTFPYTRYESEPWYAGYYPAAPDPNGNSNNYQLFSAGGDDYIILHIEDYPTYEAAAWADGVLKANTGRKAIITTHGYMDTSGNYTGKWGSTQYIRDLVTANDNVYFVLCGHFTGEYTKTTNVNGRLVHEMMADYQGRVNGGDGWLRILRFEPDEDKVYVKTYSSWHDAYEADSGSQFTLDFPMTGYTFSTIGTNSGVASGANTSLAWLGLETETKYEWYVTVTDTTVGTTPGPVWSFTTGSLKASNPDPANGAIDVDVDADLSWIAGVDAISHDVYFGTDADNLPLVSAQQLGTTYDPGTLLQSTTYYWAIDEHDSGEGVTPGDIWSFTTTLPEPVSIITAGSTWKYFDQVDSDQGDWYSPSFDDTSWAQGPAELGYGDGDEKTAINGSPIRASYYFRHTFTASETYDNLVLNVVRDDGCVVYLNGVEIGRSNMPDGDIYWNTLAASVTTNENDWWGISVDPAVTIQPGTNVLAVSVHQATLTSSDVSFNLELLGVAAPGQPIANDDSYTANEDELLVVSVDQGVLLNDNDPDNDPLTAVLDTDVSHGTLTLSDDGSFTYNPQPDFIGEDSFTYKAFDGTYYSGAATVSITVVNTNDDPPVAVDDTPATDEDVPVNIDVLGNDSDPDGDDLSIVSVTEPDQGGTAVNNGTYITYTPASNFYGVETFSYTVTDGTAGDECSATVTMTVNPVNDDPVADDDTATTDEDMPTTIDVLGNDTDVDGDSLSVISVTQPANGSVVNNGSDVTYTPNADFFGSDSFTYTAGDGNGGSDSPTVNVTVNSINDPPTANDDSVSTLRDVPVDIDVLSNDDDIEGAMLSVGSVTQPTNGSVVNNGTNVTYTPNPGYIGGDSFTYTANDGTANGNAATVSVTVNPPGPTTLFSDGFESGNLAAGGWTSSGSVAVKEPAAYEGLYGVQIGGPASIVKSVSTIGFSNIHVIYARNTKGLDSGEFLTVEWSADGATWNNVIESTQDTAWAQRDIALGAAADENASFTVRFRTNANKTNEYGFVDSVEITGATAGPDLSAPVPNPMTWATPPYATGTSSISMTATTADDVSGVEYYFDCTAGGGNDSGWQDSATYEDTGLIAGTEYTYRVQARDKSPAQNTTGWSSEASATPIDVPPVAPTGLGATAGDGQVSLDWNNNGETDLAGYNVYRATSSGGPYTQLNGTLLTASDYLDLAVTNGITYFYVVTAVDSATPTPNQSGYSSEVSATPSSQQAICVASINMSLQTAGKNTKALAGVTISQAQAGAIVYGNWYFNGRIVQTGATGTTDTSGYTEITSAPVKASSGDVFRFEVTNVVLAGYVYDPGQGVTENSITVP